MKLSRLTLPAAIPLFLCFASLSSAEEDARLLFQDDFKTGPGEGWFWKRENKAAWRASEDKGLEILIEPGNMWGPANDGKNVLVRPAPDAENGEIEITVTVENNPTAQYEQTDLTWYYDDSHMVKIGQEMVDGKLCIVMGREEKDRTRTINILPLTATKVKLRLLSDGEQVRGQFLPDGAKTWVDAGQCDAPAPENGKPHVALMCYQGAPDVEHWSRITEFRVRRLKKKS